MLKLVRRALLGALALTVALAIRAMRPIVVVRIGGLKSSRIGPFVARAEHYLCERDAGVHDGRKIDIFYHASSISNQQMKKMLGRKLRVWQFASHVSRFSNALPSAAIHVIPQAPQRDTKGYLAKYPPHLSFTCEEESQG
jgi:hypothetical protein